MYRTIIFSKVSKVGMLLGKVYLSMKNDNIVLIIGNGFDLDLKFESKYSDFAKSEEWKELYEKYASKSNHYSLIKFLNDRKETDKWFDIEQALFEYAALKTADIWHHDVSNDIQEYHALCRQLEKYFTNKVGVLRMQRSYFCDNP